eukprot:TRINITY_DN94921_c0_g1_i1.p1 TRINITY_DN94921_c0_g1~~TRINITY_DN94921_c0_g1_i1.p1  ORF type:complete len:191 (-),score=12.14 TRINITY_DN94921_c0_g1_i1:57-629(-)
MSDTVVQTQQFVYNALFRRYQFKFKATGKEPTKADIQTRLAELHNTDVNAVSISHLERKFGGGITVGVGVITKRNNLTESHDQEPVSLLLLIPAEVLRLIGGYIRKRPLMRTCAFLYSVFQPNAIGHKLKLHSGPSRKQLKQQKNRNKSHRGTAALKRYSKKTHYWPSNNFVSYNGTWDLGTRFTSGGWY